MDKDERPVLLGMNNPISAEPRFALYPYPPGCTGYRLLRMLQTRRPEVGRREYLAAFDRRNLLSSLSWDSVDAARAAVDLRGALTGRHVLLLGAGPRRALGVPELLVHPQEIDGITWRQLPHPSGRCRWYNDEDCRALAATLLEDLYVVGAAAVAAGRC